MNSKIFEYLDRLYPNPRCELEYNRDYELLIAIVLSAQTTDNAVNKATAVLFKKYDSIEKLANADLKDVENTLLEIINAYPIQRIRTNQKLFSSIANFLNRYEELGGRNQNLTIPLNSMIFGNGPSYKINKIMYKLEQAFSKSARSAQKIGHIIMRKTVNVSGFINI